MEGKNDPISIIHGIFINFFGEENVDLQGQVILVHFPKVTVTNENDRSVDITHLWVKVKLELDGTINGAFRMMRSEFTLEQFKSGYSHSHIPYTDTSNYNLWANPCLGSGPIRNTIASLSYQFSEDMWNMFCLELSKYVTVESLAGVPFMYLERIDTNTTVSEIEFPFKYMVEPSLSDRDEQLVASFIRTIIDKKPFGFNYINGSYGIAMSDRDLFITLSNLFIEYYNSLSADQQIPKEELYADRIICIGKYINNKLYYIGHGTRNTTASYQELIGRDLFRFKDRTITFNITNSIRDIEEDPNNSIFLSNLIVQIIIDRILRTINNKYGQHSSQETDPTREAHRYL